MGYPQRDITQMMRNDLKRHVVDRIPTMERWLPVCCALVVLLFPGICQASRISLELSVEVTRNDRTWSGHVLITNRGDEAAYDVQATLRAFGRENRSSMVKQLAVEEKWEPEIPIPESMDSQVVPGRYPVVLQVSYSDVNGHPFSALSVNFLEFDEALVSQINGALQATPISGNGKLILKLQNVDEKPIEANVEWVFPKELMPDRSVERIRINGKGSVVIKRRVRNLSALPGSQYPVFAIMEYDKNGRHFTTNAMTAVTVVEPASFVSSIRVPLFVLLAILAAVIVVLQFRHRRSGKGI